MVAYVNHVIFFLIFTTFLVPSTLGVMFNMVEIGPENKKDIITDGVGTYISTDGIELITTRNHTRAGRATYVELLHLWDAASGQLADFTTHFSVSIDSRNTSDRLSFFLAHSDSLVNASGGMGHPMHGTSTQLVPFVAVEFDTHSNSNWDPDDGRDHGPLDDHVGINVNSSVEFEKWGSNVSYGNQYFVRIHYDSGSQNLSVFYGGTIEVNQFELRYTVDLRNVLPEWVVFGFSSSSSSGDEFHRNCVKSWFFNSTVLHMDNKRLKEREKKKRVYSYRVTVLLAFLLLMLVIGGFFTFICLRKKTRANVQPIDQIPADGCRINSWEPWRFTFEELSLATDNFNSDQKLGEGGFGVVYIGTLTTGESVAVKKISSTSQVGIKQYKAEVQIVGGARHKHLVRVVGWCDERDTELLIVYELMENLSLDAHLFGSSRESLPWDVRYNIAHGLAKAVRYLHNECGARCILHRDLKAGNVLLDSNFEAKLGDFGMVRLLDHDTSQEMSCAGTPGYLDPECFQNGRFSQRSDIYSYGMVVLEIVTGRRCTGFINPDQEDLTTGLAGWVRNKYTNGNIREIVDPRLDNDFDVLQLEGLVALGLWCASRDSSQRPPNMEIVAHILDGSSEQSFSLIPKVEGTGQRSSLETEHTTLLVSSHPPSYLSGAWMFVSCVSSVFGWFRVWLVPKLC